LLNIELRLLQQIGDIARRAGREIMKVYETDFMVETKDDSSPVTEADKTAEDLILRSIREGITGDFPIVSEEAAAAGNIPVVRNTAFWLVDPLDGTKEFVNRNDEFTVNIALIENGRPVLGVVHAPALKETYWGASAGAFAQSGDDQEKIISCRTPPTVGLTAIVSRSHRTEEVDEYLTRFNVTSEITAGSSLKFCRIAAGQADIYPRMGRTMEWDTAAGHAVLDFAGGSVVTVDGANLGYGKPEFKNPHFIAAGSGVVEPS